MPKKEIAKIFAKELFFKFEDLHPRPNYNKKIKNNKNNKTLFMGFIILINNFGYIILDLFKFEINIYDFQAGLL
jgi:hypothetical protein